MAGRLGPQQLQTALEVALHRGHRRLERGRDLFRRQVLLVTKDQRRPLRLGQGRQQLLEPRAQRRWAVERRHAVMLFHFHP